MLTKSLRPRAIWTPAVPFNGDLPRARITFDRSYVSTGGARQFTAATSEYLSAVDSAALSMGAHSFTVSAWAYVDSYGATRPVVTKGDVSNGMTVEYWLGYSASVSAWRFFVGDGSVTYYSAYAAGLTHATSQWYFLVGSYDYTTGQIYLYVNNCDPYVANGPSAPLDSNRNFLVGANDAAGARYPFNGRIQRVGLWKKLLAAAERTFLWNGGQGQAYGDLGVAGTDGEDLLDSDCVDFWPLNEASGDATGALNGIVLTDNNSVTAASGVTTRARAYNGANQNHSVADADDLSGDGGDFFVVAHVLADSLAQPMTVAFKGLNIDAAANYEWGLQYGTGASQWRFRISDGTTATTVDAATAGTPTTGTWYFLLAWYDSANDKAYIRVNDLTADSASHSNGAQDTVGGLEIGRMSASAFPMDGRIGRTVFGKPPTAIAGLIDDIHTHFYNDGEATDHTALTDAQRSAWGVVSMWDGDETSDGDALLDKIGWRARDFEATNTEYFTIADANQSGLDIRTGDKTITCVFCAESTGAYKTLYVKGSAGVGAPGVWLHVHNTTITAFFSDGTARLTVNAAETVVVGTWYCVALTLDRDGNAQLYVNGVASGSPVDISSQTGDCNNADAAFIGLGPGGYLFDGKISVTGIWGSLKSEAEIAALYNSGEPLKWDELEDAYSGLTDDCKGYWHLDEYDGDAIDYSGNGNHLTDTNTVMSGPGPGTYPAYDMADNNTVTVEVGPGDELGLVVDGDPMQQVLSVEGNAYAFVQETASKKPTWNEISANFNRHPTATFDGVANLLRYAGELTTATEGCCVLLGRFPTIGAGLQVAFASSDEAGAVKYLLFHKRSTANGDKPCLETTGGPNTIDINVAIAAATNYLWIIQSTDLAYAMRLNRTAYAVNAAAGSDDGDWLGDQADRDNFTLGAWKSTSEANHSNLELAELLIYDRYLVADEIQRLENYSRFRYGV